MKYLVFIFFITHINASPFSYKNTDNTGMNKYDRINNIEKFLSKLDNGIMSLKRELKSSDTLLNKEIMDTKKQLKEIKKQVSSIQQSSGQDNDSKELKKEVASLKKENKVLSDKLQEVDIALKTLQEIFKRNQEQKERSDLQ